MVTIDPSESFGDEAESFNNVLTVLIFAFLATDGNLEVVVIDRNAICFSALTGTGGCSDEKLSRNRPVTTDVKSKKARTTILSAYDP